MLLVFLKVEKSSVFISQLKNLSLGMSVEKCRLCTLIILGLDWALWITASLRSLNDNGVELVEIKFLAEGGQINKDESAI